MIWIYLLFLGKGPSIYSSNALKKSQHGDCLGWGERQRGIRGLNSNGKNTIKNMNLKKCISFIYDQRKYIPHESATKTSSFFLKTKNVILLVVLEAGNCFQILLLLLLLLSFIVLQFVQIIPLRHPLPSPTLLPQLIPTLLSMSMGHSYMFFD